MKKISLSGLGCVVYIFQGNEKAKFTRKYSAKYDFQLNEEDEGCTTGNATIFFDSSPDTIGHEVSHLVDWVLYDWLEMTGQVNGELRGYITGFLTQRVTDALTKKP